MPETEMCNQNFVSFALILASPLEGSLKSRLPASTRAVRITTAMLGRRSSGMCAVIQALTIALRQITDRKEVRFTQATRSKSLVAR
jgi:hypothetical protein